MPLSSSSIFNFNNNSSSWLFQNKRSSNPDQLPQELLMRSPFRVRCEALRPQYKPLVINSNPFCPSSCLASEFSSPPTTMAGRLSEVLCRAVLQSAVVRSISAT